VRSVVGLLLLLLTWLSPNAKGDTVDFTDGTFNDSDWTTTVWNPYQFTNTSTVSFGQQLVGGDPGAYREYNYTEGNPADALDIGQVLDSATYNPQTQGAIQSFYFSIDSYIPESAWEAPSLLAFASPMVEQNGDFYASTSSYALGPGWEPTEFTYPGTTFQQVYPSLAASSPDFSTSGAPLQFGFFLILGGVSFTYGVDDFQFDVNVPEPSTGLPLLISSAAIFMCRRRIN
jgi:hypothetical protein